MTETPTRELYRFELSRRERLIPLLRCWGPYGLALTALLVASALLSLWASAWWWTGVLFVLFLMRGLLVGVVRGIAVPRVRMAVCIEERGIGFGESAPDWWISTDGIRQFGELLPGTLTLVHHNGTVITFPAGILKPEHIKLLEAHAGDAKLGAG